MNFDPTDPDEPQGVPDPLSESLRQQQALWIARAERAQTLAAQAFARLLDVAAGDTVNVHGKIREGAKERIQQFQGVVLQRSGESATETFTVRKVSGGTGVERIFPISSPFIEKIEVNKRGVVRRARIFYLRELKGKKARIKEKRV